MKGLFEYQYLSFRKGHLQNLVALAKADGHIHEEEIKLIYKIGEKYKLKTWQIDEILNDPVLYELTIPEKTRQKIGLLYELVLVMMADGIVHPKEMEFCRSAVIKFGLSMEVLDKLIRYYEDGAEDHLNWSTFLDDLVMAYNQH